MELIIVVIIWLVIYFGMRFYRAKYPGSGGIDIFINLLLIWFIIVIILNTSFIKADEYHFTITDSLDAKDIHHYKIYTERSTWIFKELPTKIYTYDYYDNFANVKFVGIYDASGNALISNDAHWIWSCDNPYIILQYIKLYGDGWEQYLSQKIYYEKLVNYYSGKNTKSALYGGYPLDQAYLDAKPYGFTKGTRISASFTTRDTRISDAIYRQEEFRYLGPYAKYID